jgi:cytochrome b-561
MASATGIPETYSNVSSNEQEPLLGRVGDVSQERGMPLYNNLVMGTTVLDSSKFTMADADLG